MSKLTINWKAVALQNQADITVVLDKLESAEARVLDLEQTLTEIERLVGGMAIIEGKLWTTE